MLVLRRNAERRHLNYVKNKVWQTFYQKSEPSTQARRFGDLLRLDEMQIPPSGTFSSIEAEGDTFTYVHTGVLEQRSSVSTTVLRAGDFQRMGKDEQQDEKNASRTHLAHVFRLRIASDSATGSKLAKGCQQERFTAARRHNSLCTVASPDGVSDSLALRSDVFIYSSVLDLGYHLVHALEPGRCVWLHIVRGNVSVGELNLLEGDGVGVYESVAVSLTAREDSEVLLVDLDAGNL